MRRCVLPFLAVPLLLTSLAQASNEPEWLQTGLIADSCFFHADFIKEKPAVAAKTLKALYDAIAYWNENPAEANAVIAAGLKCDVKDVESVIGTNGHYHEAGSTSTTSTKPRDSWASPRGSLPLGRRTARSRSISA